MFVTSFADWASLLSRNLVKKKDSVSSFSFSLFPSSLIQLARCLFVFCSTRIRLTLSLFDRRSSLLSLHSWLISWAFLLSFLALALFMFLLKSLYSQFAPYSMLISLFAPCLLARFIHVSLKISIFSLCSMLHNHFLLCSMLVRSLYSCVLKSLYSQFAPYSIIISLFAPCLFAQFSFAFIIFVRGSSFLRQISKLPICSVHYTRTVPFLWSWATCIHRLRIEIARRSFSKEAGGLLIRSYRYAFTGLLFILIGWDSCIIKKEHLLFRITVLLPVPADRISKWSKETFFENGLPFFTGLLKKGEREEIMPIILHILTNLVFMTFSNVFSQMICV